MGGIWNFILASYSVANESLIPNPVPNMDGHIL